MAISRDELANKIQKWRDVSSKSNPVDKDLFIAYLDYLTSIADSRNQDVFAVDDEGNASGDYTPEFKATQAEAMKDLGLSEDDLDSMYYDVDNPVTSETVIDKDDDGDVDVTITKQDDGDDSGDSGDDTGNSDEPHDEGLAGDTTLEEDLMLNPDMSPSEFSKVAAEKRGAKPGEPAPDFNNFTNDIARSLASRRW